MRAGARGGSDAVLRLLRRSAMPKPRPPDLPEPLDAYWVSSPGLLAGAYPGALRVKALDAPGLGLQHGTGIGRRCL